MRMAPRLTRIVPAAAGAALAVQLKRRRRTEVGDPGSATASILIDRGVDELYAYWRGFQHLPALFSRIVWVEPLGSGRSRLYLSTREGEAVWTTELTEQVPGYHLAWKTLEPEYFHHSGSLDLRPDADGKTRVTIRVANRPGAGQGHHGDVIAPVELDDALKRFKVLAEAGRPPTTGPAEK
jgi:uncharacterized membrane protein